PHRPVPSVPADSRTPPASYSIGCNGPGDRGDSGQGRTGCQPDIVETVKERTGSWLPRLQEAGERLAEEWASGRRPRRDDQPQPSERRASDEDRERIATALQDAHADGRLPLDELQERLAALYSARTLGELAGLTTDLLPADQQPLNLHGTPVS